MFGLGKVEELILLIVVILILFGAKKLPELSRGVAESIKEIRKGFREDSHASKSQADSKKSES